MPFGSGRKPAPEWGEVIDSGTKVKCKYCGITISKRIERIKQHLEKCKRIKLDSSHLSDENTLQLDCSEWEPPLKITKANPNTDISSPNTSTSTCEQVSPKQQIFPSTSKTRDQASILSYGIKTTAIQKSMLDKKIANFFYANSIAFNVADNVEFKNMIQELRPGYIPPSRKQLSEILLCDAYDELENKLKSEISIETCLTLILDGWSNISNDPILACSIHTGKNSYLFKTVDCGAAKKDAEFCSDFAETAIKEIQEKFGKDIFAVCSDNERKMIAMRNNLKSNHPELLTYGCSSHMLNLCAKDITPANIMKHIIEVQKYFRNKHNAHGWLKNKDGMMPQIPNDTRWNSQKECLKTFLKNYHKYIEIKLEHIEDFDKEIGNYLMNVGLYSEALNLCEQLEIISKGLDALQDDKATLSTAVEVWLDILENPSLSSYLPMLEKRFSENMEPFHFLANMTNPKYFGKRLTSEQEEMAEQWLADIYPNFLPYVLKLKLKDSDFFSATIFSNSVIENFSAKQWWHLIKSKSIKKSIINVPEAEEFCDFFIKLHSCPPSNASIERIFSTYGFVWSKVRNRLGNDKAEKLVKIYRHYRKEPNDW